MYIIVPLLPRCRTFIVCAYQTLDLFKKKKKLVKGTCVYNICHIYALAAVMFLPLVKSRNYSHFQGNWGRGWSGTADLWSENNLLHLLRHGLCET